MTPVDLRREGAVLLVSCYELGHAPHGLAMPSAFLRRAGYAPAVLDLAIDKLDEAMVSRAEVIALSVPMHTSLRLALEALPRLRALAPTAAVGFFGHYAVLHRAHLASLGAAFCLGGELENALVAALDDIAGAAPPGPPPPAPAHDPADAYADADADESPLIPLVRLRFPAPDRTLLSPPDRYAKFIAADGEERVAGYAETSRGCLDHCRHCPLPAVYGGRFFIIDRDRVLDDIESQVDAGARHITFGDPDFLNGPGHGFAVIRALHRRFPEVTYDITAQVTHLLQKRDRLPELVETGCAFVTTAVESLSDRVLAALAKRHRRAQVEELLAIADQVGLVVRPTFVAFTPWTTLEDMVELCDFIVDRGLTGTVAPVQMSVRLLVPPGSLLLEVPEQAAAFGPLDPDALGHRWVHQDPRMDALQHDIESLCANDARAGRDPQDTFDSIRRAIYRAAAPRPLPQMPPRPKQRFPRMSEPWFC